MRTIIKKSTIEEFKDGQLVKRTIEEVTEEVDDKDLEPVKAADPNTDWGDSGKSWVSKGWKSCDANISYLSN